MKENAIFRVRDWKGYGIVQQCGTCEPLQNPTSSSRITSDLKDKGKRSLCSASET